MAGVQELNFDSPDDTRTPPRPGSKSSGRAAVPRRARIAFEPGWKGSECVKPIAGTEKCQVHHVVLARLAVGREVVLGLRPEDLEPVAPGADGTGLRFPVVVDTVESTGADVYAHVRVDGAQDDSGHLDQLLADGGDAPRSRARDGASRIVARLDAASGAEPSRRMTLGIEPEPLYVFDAATGDALVGANRDAAQAASAIPSGEAG